jgi:uncharacterized protein YhdP
VAAWLSARAGQPVRFDALDTAWTRRGPLLQLKGLRIGEGQGLRIGEAEVLVSMYAGLLPGHSLTELRLRGLALVLQRADDGRWSVQGLPQPKAGGDPLDTLRRLGELQVIGGRLRVDAPSLNVQTELPRIDLRLRVNGQRLAVGARAWGGAGGHALAVAARSASSSDSHDDRMRHDASPVAASLIHHRARAAGVAADRAGVSARPR